MLLQNVLADLGRHVQGEVPGHRLKNAVDAHHGRLQTVACRGLRVVALLGDAAAAQGRITVGVDGLGVLVRQDDNVVGLTFVQHDVVLVRRNPGTQRFNREVHVESVVSRFRSAVLVARDGPAVDVVAAGDDAVVAGG